MADDLGPMVASLKIFQKYYIKIEQSLLERFFNFILWDFERSDNIESEVKMADNLGPMAWLFLPENVQVQYLQKIALRAENPSGPQTYFYNATDWTDYTDYLLGQTKNPINLLNL